MRGGLIYLALFLAALVAVGCSSGDGSAAKPADQPKVQAPAEKAKPITEQELGLKFYPGAKVKSATGLNKGVSAELETEDPEDKVVVFYERELGVKAKKERDLVTIDGSKAGKTYMITITSINGITSISIMGEEKR